MENHEASVEKIEDEEFLLLSVGAEKYQIPLTKDEPNDIKKVFNSLLIHLKDGLYCFKLKEVEDGDIYYFIAKEYVSQLNGELKKIYDEMIDLELIEAPK